jgi:TIR domain
MAYVPGFDHDVFISFGHIDNEAPSADWVTELHTFVQGRLRQTCSKEVQVWRDPRLDGLDRLDDTIRAAVGKSAIFVSVLSPGFAQSEWCSTEIQWFLSANPAGVNVENKSRIVRAVKTPLIDVPWPKGLDDGTLHYRFYQQDDQSLKVQEFAASEGAATKGDFDRVCDDMTQGIAGMLRRMRRMGAVTAPPGPAGKMVFVADVTSDARDLRQSVMAELRDRSAQVLEPGVSADRPAVEITQKLAAALATADVAVHIFGRYYGMVPEGTAESLIELQVRVVREASAARSSDRPLQQILWCPDTLSDPEANLRAFLDKLEGLEPTEKDACNIEIIKGPLSRFKEALIDILSRRAPTTDTTATTRSIYLLCHRRDIADPDLQQIRSWLLEHGYPADLPVYQGEMTALQQLEEESILEANTTLIYYGSAQDAWVREKRRRIQNVWAKQPSTDVRRRAVYLAHPEDDLKQAQYLTVPGRKLREADRFPPLLVLGDCHPFNPDMLGPLTGDSN